MTFHQRAAIKLLLTSAPPSFPFTRLGADVNETGGTSETALQIAALSGSLKVARFLVEKGAEVNITGKEHGSALQAATQSGSLELVRLLVEQGAEVTALGMHGTAFHAAATDEDLEIPSFLVENGHDVIAVCEVVGRQSPPNFMF